MQDVAELEACLGVAPAAVQLKCIDHLDSEACRWLAASPLAFLASANQAGITATLAGGAPGFATVLEPRTVSIARAAIDHSDALGVGSGVGLLFLVAGLGETLRVNGRVAAVRDAQFEVAVDEVYVHCAKAFIRSDFWNASVRVEVPSDVAAFVAEARFLALATADAAGHADLSPKGDPAGNLLRWSAAGVSYAERPGNRRADSLRNLLTRPQATAVALIPGSCTCAILRGRTLISTDEAARAAFAVDGKTPKLITTLEDPRIELYSSPALQRAAVWPARPFDHGIDPAAVLLAHVKLNRTGGVAARLLRATVTKQLVATGLARDYKKHLY